MFSCLLGLIILLNAQKVAKIILSKRGSFGNFGEMRMEDSFLMNLSLYLNLIIKLIMLKAQKLAR